MTIDWATKDIMIPQSDLTFVSGTFYTYDTNQGRIDMNELLASEDGIVFLDCNSHNTEVTISGVTYARTIEIINGYMVTFEDGQYSVQLEGSNNNMWDVFGMILHQNQVQAIPTNSAGLIVVTQGSGVTEQDKLDIADRVWDETQSEHVAADSMGLSQLDGVVDPVGIADEVWDALSADHLTVDTFGAVIQRLLEDISYPITSAEVSGETHLTIWTDQTLTTPIRVINIGTPEIPKRLDVP